MKENLNRVAGLGEWREERPGCMLAERISSEFWAQWRQDRDALKSLGIRVRPGSGKGAWEVRWNVPADYALPAAAVSAEPEIVLAPVADWQSKLDAGRRWSAEQMAIFEFFATPSATRSAIVRARAGTGKTTTIKAAFAVAPEAKMLYAVFNKKNQVEAQEKIQDARVDVRTLHSLGYRYIQAVWSGVKPDDAVEFDRVQTAAPNTPDEVAAAVVKLVGFAKNTAVAPSVQDLENIADERDIFCSAFEDPSKGGWNQHRLAECAAQCLELAKVRDSQGRVSFSDMVWLPVAMGWVCAWYQLVVVDEAQDMSLPQLIMARGAVKPGGRIVVVGDDRQAIYLFRGARLGAMDWMKAELGAVEFGLTTTYRCPKSVVALARDFVPDYNAHSSAPEGEVREAGVSELLEKVQVGDAVLSRVNAPLMSLCLQLLRRGISARIEGRDIGQQLVNQVRKFNAKSVPDFLRKVATWEQKQINRAMASSRNQESKVNMYRDQALTLVAVAEGCANVAEIEIRIRSLFEDSDRTQKPAVVFSSVHKAKGLEWGRVWVLAETFRIKGATTEVSEEANIYYVAITRAKQSLMLVAGGSVEKN